jgi:hypothetical protein
MAGFATASMGAVERGLAGKPGLSRETLQALAGRRSSDYWLHAGMSKADVVGAKLRPGAAGAAEALVEGARARLASLDKPGINRRDPGAVAVLVKAVAEVM